MCGTANCWSAYFRRYRVACTNYCCRLSTRATTAFENFRVGRLHLELEILPDEPLRDQLERLASHDGCVPQPQPHGPIAQGVQPAPKRITLIALS